MRFAVQYDGVSSREFEIVVHNVHLHSTHNSNILLVSNYKSTPTQMTKVQFEPIEHKYTLDGKPLTGVTSILAVIGKPHLIKWAVKLQHEYILENATKKGAEYSVTKDILDKAKLQSDIVRDEAGARGTEVHNQVDNYIKHSVQPSNPRATAIINWIKHKNFEIIESEKIVFSEKHWYAGTLDLLVKDSNGKYWIIDFKTSKSVSSEYLYQMAGYDIAYSETENQLNIAGYIICHVDTDAKIDEYILENQDIKEQCKNAFLAANTIYKASKNIIINQHKYGKKTGARKSTK